MAQPNGQNILQHKNKQIEVTNNPRIPCECTEPKRYRIHRNNLISFYSQNRLIRQAPHILANVASTKMAPKDMQNLGLHGFIYFAVFRHLFLGYRGEVQWSNENQLIPSLQLSAYLGNHGVQV